MSSAFAIISFTISAIITLIFNYPAVSFGLVCIAISVWYYKRHILRDHLIPKKDQPEQNTHPPEPTKEDEPVSDNEYYQLGGTLYFIYYFCGGIASFCFDSRIGSYILIFGATHQLFGGTTLFYNDRRTPRFAKRPPKLFPLIIGLIITCPILIYLWLGKITFTGAYAFLIFGIPNILYGLFYIPLADDEETENPVDSSYDDTPEKAA